MLLPPGPSRPALLVLPALLACLTTPLLRTGAAEPTRLPLAGAEASISLPADWAAIDPQWLIALADQLARQSDGEAAEAYQYGFRPGRRRGAPFGPPLVLVQIRENGRLPWREAVELGESRLPPRVKVQADGSHPTLPALEPRTLELDMRLRAIRSESLLRRPLGPPIEIRSVVYLTRRGTIGLYGFLESPPKPASLAAVVAILDSVELDPAVVYRPRLGERLGVALRRSSTWYLAAALMLVATLLVAYRGRRRGDDAEASP